MQLKICRKCGVSSENVPFSLDGGKIVTICKPCKAIYAHERRCANVYKCTPEEYAERMEASDECEICGSKCQLKYDHNHSTAKFRGVLCNECNTGLGKLGDTPESLRIALQYLEERH